MKSIDKFLVAIVIGVIVLVAAAFLVVLRQPQATYRAEDVPDGVVYNYLLALQQEDYARAYNHLSPSLAGYPATLAEFVGDVNRNRWQFGLDGNGASFAITDTSIFDADALVTVEMTRFNNNGLFDSNTYTETSYFTLSKSAGDWKIVRGEYLFWVSCWDSPETCK